MYIIQLVNICFVVASSENVFGARNCLQHNAGLIQQRSFAVVSAVNFCNCRHDVYSYIYTVYIVFISLLLWSSLIELAMQRFAAAIHIK